MKVKDDVETSGWVTWRVHDVFRNRHAGVEQGRRVRVQPVESGVFLNNLIFKSLVEKENQMRNMGVSHERLLDKGNPVDE